MNLRAAVVASVVALSLTACATQDDAAHSDGTWVGTITTEGDITTAINESGSVWGGAARLVEEASIGVESGPEEYMFGGVGGVHVDAERIYVSDAQAPIVRMYDYAGNHLGELGGPGQGPGEYSSPAFIATAPDGRIFVLDGRELNVYSQEGEPLGRWPAGVTNCCLYPIGVDNNGVPWVATTEVVDQRFGRDAVQAVGPDGRIGEPRWVAESAITPAEMQLPFTAATAFTVTPTGEIVSGDSNEYRFRVQRHDGTTLVVESSWEPVPVKAAEADYWIQLIRMMTGASGAQAPDIELPDFKPVFHNFVGSQTGEIWVLRHAEGVEVTDCLDPSKDQPPMSLSSRDFCWPFVLGVDAFGADGRFLGKVELPDDVLWLEYTRTSIRGDTVVTTTEDDDGTIMVKRYRLVLPGEQ